MSRLNDFKQSKEDEDEDQDINISETQEDKEDSALQQCGEYPVRQGPDTTAWLTRNVLLFDWGATVCRQPRVFSGGLSSCELPHTEEKLHGILTVVHGPNRICGRQREHRRQRHSIASR